MTGTLARLAMRATLTLLLGAPAALPASAQTPAGNGEALWKSRCTSCHAIDADRVGPRHGGLIGRKAGSVPGFAYSPALKAAGFTWDAARLDQWLQGPGKMVPGTRMFRTVGDAGERAAIIAYLGTLRG